MSVEVLILLPFVIVCGFACWYCYKNKETVPIGKKGYILWGILGVFCLCAMIVFASLSSNVSSGSSNNNTRVCPSCGERAKLYTRELLDGTGDYKTWCDECWDTFDELNIYN